MSELATSLQVNFASREAESPFELVTGDNDQGGSAPVQVAFSHLTVTVGSWGVIFRMSQITPLQVTVPGRKRVKLYCSETAAQGVTLFVDNGPATVRVMERMGIAEFPREIPVNTAVSLGRRSEPVVEPLTWSGEVRKRLRWFYDQPEVEILQQTVFRDRTGAVVEGPRYDPQRGEFFTRGEAFGALVVRYAAGFSLFDVVYDNGQGVASPDQFAEMQRAWSSGNITSTEIPPVRIIALSGSKAATGSFERVFWPIGAPIITFRFGPDDGEEEERDQEEYAFAEIPGTRQTVTRRVYNPQDNSQFVEVRQTVYLEAQDTVTGRIFKLRLLNAAD
ncbi:MAG: hypothetical protein HQL76_05810 [Magnetococcales bacterium]|nr:hypothetical protein [Magnetococcales bacterium]